MKKALRYALLCSPGLAAIALLSHLNIRSAQIERQITENGENQRLHQTSDAGKPAQGDAYDDLKRAQEIARELDRKQMARQEAAFFKLRVINQLVDGKITLVAAARTYRDYDLERAPDTYELVTQSSPGRSDLEKYCRRVLKEVEPLANKFQKNPVGPSRLPIWRAQLRALIEREQADALMDNIMD